MLFLFPAPGGVEVDQPWYLHAHKFIYLIVFLQTVVLCCGNILLYCSCMNRDVSSRATLSLLCYFFCTRLCCSLLYLLLNSYFFFLSPFFESVFFFSCLRVYKPSLIAKFFFLFIIQGCRLLLLTSAPYLHRQKLKNCVLIQQMCIIS